MKTIFSENDIVVGMAVIYSPDAVCVATFGQVLDEVPHDADVLVGWVRVESDGQPVAFTPDPPPESDPAPAPAPVVQP